MAELLAANKRSILENVGFNNPDWTWSELEAALSDRGGGTDPWERGDPRARHRGLGGAQERQGLGGAQEKARRDGRAPGSPSWNAGGDGPAWSRKRQPFEASAAERWRTW